MSPYFILVLVCLLNHLNKLINLTYNKSSLFLIFKYFVSRISLKTIFVEDNELILVFVYEMIHENEKNKNSYEQHLFNAAP